MTVSGAEWHGSDACRHHAAALRLVVPLDCAKSLPVAPMEYPNDGERSVTRIMPPGRVESSASSRNRTDEHRPRHRVSELRGSGALERRRRIGTSVARVELALERTPVDRRPIVEHAVDTAQDL